jgi:cell division protein FtsL
VSADVAGEVTAELSGEVTGSRSLSREGPRLTGRAAALLVAITFLAILALVPARQLLDQRGQIAELERRATQLENQNADLRSEISHLRDPAELERLARECLGMVAPGETVLVVPGADPDRADC